ncbi:MAG: energy-coupling factor transporter transmembrane component T [Desulfotignum sp.]
MADLTLFSFRAGATPLHALDVRIKTVLVCMLSMTLFFAEFSACLACFLVVYPLIRSQDMTLFTLLIRLKGFVLLLSLMAAARAVTVPGDPIWSFFDIEITRQGLAQGSLVATRFFLVMVIGMLFAVTTRPADLKSAAQWFLAPVPFIPEKRVGLMISLFLRFFPLILSQAGQTADAVNSRCGSFRKNPVRRIRFLSLPLLRKTVMAADHLSLAMTARCYTEKRTDPEFEPGGKERIFLMAGAGLCLGMILLSRESFWMIFWSSVKFVVDPVNDLL